MKIKLAVLEKDLNYLNRFSIAFGAKYAEKVEIHCFTDMEMALREMEASKFDMLIAGELFEVDTKKLPKHCGFAYFTESSDVDVFRGQPAIGKYQRADLLYKQILNVYSENIEDVSGLKHGDGQAKLIAFTSPSGGVGTSSLAAACALRYAQQGKQVLYLNLEPFGSADLYFTGEGQFDMSDIIFALKSKKANLAVKLESCVKKSAENVHFFSAAKLALDMQELTTEEIVRLLTELQSSGMYTHIIADMEFSVARSMLERYRNAHAIVWVSDGSAVANLKVERAYTSLSAIEESADAPLTKRLCLFYNQYSNKTGQSVANTELRVVGGSSRFEHASNAAVVSGLAKLDALDKIL